jgi:hypothetical protein
MSRAFLIIVGVAIALYGINSVPSSFKDDTGKTITKPIYNPTK